MSDVHERLRRLLLLVPYVAKHQGIAVERLAQELGLARDELLKDLEMLTYVGHPPFQPGDFIDIYMENDKVFVHLDQRFCAPPRLTVSEAVALSSAAELLRTTAGDSLQSALQKLAKVVPPEARARYREMGQKLNVTTAAPRELEPLTRAISEHREVQFEYASQTGEGGVMRRTVHPYELVHHRGLWYVNAYCCTRQDVRLFRLDRIRDLTVTDTAFEPRPFQRRGVPNPAQAQGDVRVHFSPKMAAYLRERFGTHAQPLPNGGVEVRVSGDSERWLTRWVLSFGGDAVVVEPASVREAVARAAQEIAAGPLDTAS